MRTRTASSRGRILGHERLALSDLQPLECPRVVLHRLRSWRPRRSCPRVDPLPSMIPDPQVTSRESPSPAAVEPAFSDSPVLLDATRAQQAWHLRSALSVLQHEHERLRRLCLVDKPHSHDLLRALEHVMPILQEHHDALLDPENAPRRHAR